MPERKAPDPRASPDAVRRFREFKADVLDGRDAHTNASLDFASYDHNDDGVLDYKEFCQLVLSTELQEHSEDELRERFRELDEDQSGQIDRAEYICFYVIEALTHVRTRLIDLLDRMDANKNRKVNGREFREAIKKLGFDAEPKYVALVFQALDESGDGEIDLKELTTVLRPSTIVRNKHAIRRVCGRKSIFLKTVKLTAASGQSVQDQLRVILDKHRVRVIDLFHDWDVDNDMNITAAEFREAIRQLGYDAPRAEVDTLFSFLDRDRFGKIHFSELHRALRVNAPRLRRVGTATQVEDEANEAATSTSAARTSTSVFGAQKREPIRSAAGSARGYLDDAVAAVSTASSAAPARGLAGNSHRLVRLASLLESTGHVAEIEDRLQASERTASQAASEVERLTSECAELREQVECMQSDRTSGIQQITLLARAVSVAERKVCEREAEIERLHKAKESAYEVQSLREENALLNDQLKMLAERAYTINSSLGGAAASAFADVDRSPTALIHNLPDLASAVSTPQTAKEGVKGTSGGTRGPSAASIARDRKRFTSQSMTSSPATDRFR